MKKLFSSLLVVTLLGAGCAAPADTTPQGPLNQSPSSTTPATSTTPTATSTLSIQTLKADLIRVNNLPDNSLIQSPLQVSGEARGTWYFEASFPIELRDGNNQLLTQAIAQAQTDWMTTNFVPFSATLTFTTPTTTNGTLILKKDNPSGEPQHDNQLVIPVTF